ncbi:MAG: hypothetical protein WBC91_19180 [Phototrophicaceae bacterium]
MAQHQTQYPQDKNVLADDINAQLRRLMYERIAQGNALSEVDCKAHNLLKPKFFQQS